MNTRELARLSRTWGKPSCRLWAAKTTLMTLEGGLGLFGQIQAGYRHQEDAQVHKRGF